MAILGSASATDLDPASPWWLEGVVYQVYPRSFADSTGDGVGDLQGLIDHLDHLAGTPESLGVDAIWLSPIYPSPMLDGGYDVMDYAAVDPVFGTLADLDRLIDECHRRGVRLILDLVMNHTSSLHPWFLESRLSRTGPFADFFLWRDPSGWDPEGRPQPPNNWLSWFGGSAWEWEPRRQQFYLHTFLPEQPDVNWRSPALRAEMWSMVTGWLDRGVDGFRLDVFNAFLKAEDMPSNPEVAGGSARSPGTARSIVTTRTSPSCTTSWRSSEASPSPDPGRPRSASCSRAASRPRSGTGRRATWCSTGSSSRHRGRRPPFGRPSPPGRPPGRGRWPATVLSNHDRSRHVSRYLETLGRDDRATADAVAKAAATIELTLRGTPFLYYGEEIGALDITVPRDQAQDRAAVQMAGWWNRDGCRAPMAWSDGPTAGFTDGTPWLPIAADATSRNVELQRASESSVLAHYRRLLALRRGSTALRTGELELVDVGDPDVLAYHRRAADDAALVVVRFGLDGGEIELPEATGPWKVVLSSHDLGMTTVGARVTLRPLEAMILQPAWDTVRG